MPKEEIVFRMFPDGKRELEADGFTGKACDKATAKMLKSLGKKGAEKRKSVFNQANKDAEKQMQW